MALNLSGLLGGLGQAIGGIDTSGFGNVSSILGGGLQIAAGAFQQPALQAAYGPAYSPPPVYQQSGLPQAQQTMAVFPGGAAVAARIGAMTAPILTKIAVKLGLRAKPSLQRAMQMIRSTAKLLTSPEAVAGALGVSVAELASLITASSARKRRRMNPANSKALKRAARRIKSFHKLCTHTDVLKGRGRGARSSACGTCKKKPCRC